jgi:hypothetical protein
MTESDRVRLCPFKPPSTGPSVYKPESPCVLFSVRPTDGTPRVCVPNARGEYTQLKPGVKYFEQRVKPLVVDELAPPTITHRTIGSQVNDDALAPMSWNTLQRYLGPTE